MCETRNESYSKRVSVAVSADSHQPSLTQDTSEGCFHDISLSVSEPICRICHCSSEEEELIQPCRCSGSVGYTHESCIRKWIVGSTNCACELCIYKFKTETKRIADIRKVTKWWSFIFGHMHFHNYFDFKKTVNQNFYALYVTGRTNSNTTTPFLRMSLFEFNRPYA
jgi:hypothetical protein